MVHCQPFLGRDKVLLVTAHVVTGKQGFDNGRTGGGCADTDVFQAIPQFGFLQLLAATLHCRKQAALGVQWTGLGLFLHVLRRLQGEGFAGLQGRKGGGFFFLVLLSTDGTPSGGLDNRPFGGKVATRCGETNRCNVLYATGGEGFEQAGGNHIVHLALVLRQFAGQTFGDNQGMVIGDFPCVHAAAVECRPFQGGGTGGESGVLLQKGNAGRDFVENIVGDKAGAGTGVAKYLFLVKRLCYGKGFVG